MKKETFLRHKTEVLCANIKAHESDLSSNRETLTVNPAVSYVEKQENYEQRNFESTERLITILNNQSTIRGTQHIFHKLHVLRNL